MTTEHAMTDEQIKVLKFSLRRLIAQSHELIDEEAQSHELKAVANIERIQKDIETAEECLAFFEPETEDIETQHTRGLVKVLRDMAGMYASGIVVGEALTAGADALEEKLTSKPLDGELVDLQAWCVQQENSCASVGQNGRAIYWERCAEAVRAVIPIARKWIDATED